MGYRKKGSKASLKASATIAALLLAGGYLMGGPYATAGLVIALGISLRTHIIQSQAGRSCPDWHAMFDFVPMTDLAGCPFPPRHTSLRYTEAEPQSMMPQKQAQSLPGGSSQLLSELRLYDLSSSRINGFIVQRPILP